MAENNDAGDGGQQNQGKADEFTPITSQEDFERALGRRLERERSKFSDYDDLKAKAAKFDEVEERDKTELQKAQERVDAAEKRADANERKALVAQVAAAKGVPAHRISGATKEELEADADAYIAERDAGKKAPTPAKKLASGSSSVEQKTGEKGRAAAALRAMRQG